MIGATSLGKESGPSKRKGGGSTVPMIGMSGPKIPASVSGLPTEPDLFGQPRTGDAKEEDSLKRELLLRRKQA